MFNRNIKKFLIFKRVSVFILTAFFFQPTAFSQPISLDHNYLALRTGFREDGVSVGRYEEEFQEALRTAAQGDGFELSEAAQHIDTYMNLLDSSDEDAVFIRGVAEKFDLDSEITAVSRLGEIGRINRNFVIHLESGQRLLIQGVNALFTPEAIDRNMVLLEEIQPQAREANILPDYWEDVRFLDVKPEFRDASRKNRKFFYDESGGAWKMAVLAEDVYFFNELESVPPAQQLEIAHAAGEAIATFYRLLDLAGAERWEESLPDLHTTKYHIDYFLSILKGDEEPLSLHHRRGDPDQVRRKPVADLERYRNKLAQVVRTVLSRRNLIDRLASSEHRAYHGDTKINNILFREVDGRIRPAMMVDLDTIGVGPAGVDIGDFLRSAANISGEEPENLGNVQVSLDVVRAAVEGYAQNTQEEQEAVDATRALFIELAMRFIADWMLKGDKRYFGARDDDYFLQAALVQLEALEALETALEGSDLPWLRPESVENEEEERIMAEAGFSGDGYRDATGRYAARRVETTQAEVTAAGIIAGVGDDAEFASRQAEPTLSDAVFQQWVVEEGQIERTSTPHVMALDGQTALWVEAKVKAGEIVPGAKVVALPEESALKAQLIQAGWDIVSQTWVFSKPFEKIESSLSDTVLQGDLFHYVLYENTLPLSLGSTPRSIFFSREQAEHLLGGGPAVIRRAPDRLEAIRRAQFLADWSA